MQQSAFNLLFLLCVEQGVLIPTKPLTAAAQSGSLSSLAFVLEDKL